MKTTHFFTLLLFAIFGFALMAPQLSEAGEHRKKLSNCTTCKMPVYSYYRFKTYENHQAVYSWEISGHSKCGLKSTVPDSTVAKHEGAKSVEANKMASATSEVKPAKKAKSTQGAKKQAAKSKSEDGEGAYASAERPIAYGGGSGYGQQGGYGVPVYGGGHHRGNYVNDRRGGHGYGFGYGTGTVKRTVTVTRSRPFTT
ncbi:MAG: hypothetical protein GXP30_09230, partial [Verrucomicrobia bacterium]|nr:hypothetical protein [Verrucomicrobiota bacterium]